MNLTIFDAILEGIFARRKRTCPSCKRSQLAPADKRDRAISCRFCGKAIPAPKGSRGRRRRKRK